ncbi:MAG: nuclear transport factor 2 family protein [Kofleriaceae bacterium]
MSSEADLRDLIDERVRAIRAKDLDAVLAGYAEDVITFDLVAPLANRGKAAVRKRLAEWLGSFETALDYELRDVTLAIAGDVAFDHHVTHVHGTNKQGQTIEMWFRETLGYRRGSDGTWRCVHQHSSSPFDMTTMKAVLDLKP